MADTSIEWTNKTWNPVVGCARVSPGCENCYAERMAHRLELMGQERYVGLTRKTARGRVQWSGMARFVPEMLSAPLRVKKPQMWFVNSMSDLFHDDITNEQIASVFGVMAACPRHTFQVLTKRPERMTEWFRWCGESRGSSPYVNHETSLCVYEAEKVTGEAFGVKCQWPLPNVWLGVSVEDQKRANERIPLLLQTPAAVRWISAEPLLGEITLTNVVRESIGRNALAVDSPSMGQWPAERHLDWVVVGGESGYGARAFNAEWARKVVRECAAEGIPCFVKQLGAYPYADKGGRDFPLDLRGKNRKGGDMTEWPEDLRVRQWPKVTGG